MVDRSTKYAHFTPLTHSYTAAQIAHVFFDNIHIIYGLPTTIVSDTDTIFLSSFCTTLFQFLGTKLHPYVNHFTEERKAIMQLLKDRMMQVKNKMKLYADKHRTETYNPTDKWH